MKKLLMLAVCGALAISLAGCGQSEAAKTVDNQISALGEITLESEAAISDAEAAVEGLSEEDRDQLTKTDVLEQARADYDELILDEQANVIEEKIAAIGEVSINDMTAFDAAIDALVSADHTVQERVENMDVLDAARESLVAQVSSLIDQIGEVTKDSRGAIDAAQDAYDSLTKNEQSKVQNHSKLKAAQDAYKEFGRQEAMAILSGMHIEEDKVQNMTFYTPNVMKYYSNGSWAADQRCFLIPYLGMQGDHVWLRAIANYTGNDWVFFRKMIFAVDDERYTKTFNYFDIVHDNGGGYVWEYIDFPVESDSDIELLRAIADSNETIIRFKGDDYAQDFTMNAADKQAIQDILTAYDALS